MSKYSKHAIEAAANRILGAIHNGVSKKIAFYASLVAFIRAETFVESTAEALIALNKELADNFTRDYRFDAHYLLCAHRGYHEDNFGQDILNEVVEVAFKNLAPHMRSPEVRAIFKDFLNLVDPEEKDLYVHTANVRRLDGQPNGCAVVTLVVNDYDKLDNLLHKNVVGSSTVEWVHPV